MGEKQPYLLRDKVERFIADLYVALRRYPKAERHVLAAETRQSAYGLLRNVIVVTKLPDKVRYLEQADTALLLTLAQMRIAMQLQYLPFATYERLAVQADEIGRMIGGWLKKQK